MNRSTCGGEYPVILVSDIVEYFYCPRKVYYLKVLGVPFVPKRKMILGSSEDEKEKKRLCERKTVYGFSLTSVVEIMHHLSLEDANLGLEGQLDTLIRLESGELIPIDYKFTDEVFVQRNYKKQLVAYSLLVDSSFKTNVVRGIIYFTKQRRPIIVPITYEDKSALVRDLEKIRQIISGESIPRKVPEYKCSYCEVSRYCT
ncbi:MAG: CRISPR-associated protein Cas4 [Candidatus Methanomethylicaceae archaeon]